MNILNPLTCCLDKAAKMTDVKLTNIHGHIFKLGDGGRFCYLFMGSGGWGSATDNGPPAAR